MLVIKENGRVYITESIYYYTSAGGAEQMLVPENMPIFKAVGSRTAIAGECLSALDQIRYVRLPFPKELSQKAMVDKIMPAVDSVLSDLNKDEEDGDVPSFLFAKGDRAFETICGDIVREIGTDEAFGWQNELFRYALACTTGMPLMQRLQSVYKTVGRILGEDLFPFIMTDTASLKIQVIEEERA